LVRIDGFLATHEHDLLLKTGLSKQQGRLEVSVIGDGSSQYKPEVRSSWVLCKGLHKLIPWFLPRVQDALPDVLPRLQIAPFAMGEVELQMTVHRSGGFYKVDQDTGKTALPA